MLTLVSLPHLLQSQCRLVKGQVQVQVQVLGLVKVVVLSARAQGLGAVEQETGKE
jgi:hypothetical protein